MPGKEENAGIVWRTLQGIYRGCLRSGRGTRARLYVRAAPRNGLEGAEGAGKKADSGEPKLRECETGLGHGERASAGTNRRSHTPDRVRTNREREGSERARGRAKKQRRGSWAEGKPKTRGCGTGAGIYEQAGTRAQAKERAEGAGGKLV